MKKFLAVFVVLAMAMSPMMLGCASMGPNPVSNFFCHPTDGQKMAAKIGVAVVQVALNVGATYLGVAQIAALVDAQQVYQSVVDGYCATQAQWDTATAAVETARAYGAKGLKVSDENMAILHQTRW